MQGRTLNAGPYARCRAVRSMHGRALHAGPLVQCRTVRSMQGRALDCMAHAQRKAVRLTQGRTIDAGPARSAGPHVPCRAERSTQGRALNVLQHAQRRVARSKQGRTLTAGPQAEMQGRALNAGPYAQCRAARSMHGRASNARLCAQCRAVGSHARPCVPCRAVRSLQKNRAVRGACIALQEIEEGFQAQNEERQGRVCKLFLFLARMLLFRPHRGGLTPKQRLLNRFVLFARGSWTELLNVSRDHAEAARMGSVRRRRMQVDTPQKRAERAQMLVLMGEVSAGRHALDGPLSPKEHRKPCSSFDVARRFLRTMCPAT